MKHLAVGITQNDGLRLVVVSIDTTKHICSGCTVPTGSCVEHKQVVMWTAVNRLLWDHCGTRLPRKKQTTVLLFSQLPLDICYNRYDRNFLCLFEHKTRHFA